MLGVWEMDSNIKNLEYALKATNHLQSSTDENICERFLKSITESEKPSIVKLIQLILNLKIKNLDEVKTIFESCDYPFNYNSSNFTDLYCVALKTFIEYDLYDGKMPDIYHFKNVNIYKNFSTENDVEKYILLLYHILISQYNNKEMKDTSEYFLYELHLNLETEYDNRPIPLHNQLFYPQKMPEYNYLRRFITLFEEKDNNEESTKLISTFSLETLTKVFIVAFVDDYYLDMNEKKHKISFRSTIADIQKSHYKRAFMEWLWEPYDENEKQQNNKKDNDTNQDNTKQKQDCMQWLAIENEISYDKFAMFYDFFCNSAMTLSVDENDDIKQFTHIERKIILANYLYYVIKTMLDFNYSHPFSIRNLTKQEIKTRIIKIINMIK